MTLSEFLMARIAEDEAVARKAEDGPWDDDDDINQGEIRNAHPHRGTVGWIGLDADRAHVIRHDPARVQAECEAKRRIVEWHESWPVLVETEPTFEQSDDADPTRMTFQMHQQIAWLTTQEYRKRFGDEPPSSPIMRALAAVYADHPDYRQEWKP